MKDIRPKAEERARQRQQEAQGGQNNAARPPGAGFMSERTRAKEALRVEVNTYTGENVRKIAATNATAQEDRILRVAAYCRVSTDDIDQLVSIELQKNNYRDMIKANPKWKYVGTYATFKRMWHRLMLAAGCVVWREVKPGTSRPDDILKQIKATLTPHYFRHNYVTMLYESGIDPLVAMKIVGHTDYQTTANIYTHIKEEMLKKATVDLEGVFKKRAGKE